MIDNSVLKKYQNRNAVREVLGSLIINPTLLIEHKMNKNDFVEPFYKILYVAINNLANMGSIKLNGDIIGEYLRENYPTEYLIFQKNNGVVFIEKASAYASPENFEANYLELKKFSLLRDFLRIGFDVSDYYDPFEVDPDKIYTKRLKLEKDSLDDIINHFKKKILFISENYTLKSNRDSIKAGEFDMEQKERWKEAPSYGLSYSSNFLTTIVKGIQKKKFGVISAGTGVGKTRVSVSNICHSFCPKYYDRTKGEFVDNPHGNQNRALYIGTEMELLEEISPILWAYIADVPEDHIKYNKYEPGEEERVNEAIRILKEEANIFLEYVPDYDVDTLEQIIEKYSTIYKVGHIFFDYIHITTDLISEYQSKSSNNIAIREDQVLGNLSAKLKELSRKYNVSIDSWTQVSGDFKNERNRDQTIVRGSKAIIDKVDWAGIMSRPTPRELKLLEKTLRSSLQLGKNEPNSCISIYKNRGGKYNNVKIWLYVDYDTMRVHDLFVTDYDYKLLDIEQTFVKIDEDQKIEVYDSKEILLNSKFNKNLMGLSTQELRTVDEEKEEETSSYSINSDWDTSDLILNDLDFELDVEPDNDVDNEPYIVESDPFLLTSDLTSDLTSNTEEEKPPKKYQAKNLGFYGDPFENLNDFIQENKEENEPKIDLIEQDDIGISPNTNEELEAKTSLNKEEKEELEDTSSENLKDDLILSEDCLQDIDVDLLNSNLTDNGKEESNFDMSFEF